MSIPNKNDLIFYSNRPLTSADWETNWLKLIDYLTGTSDVTFGSVTTANITVTNNLNVTSNLVVGGSITADSFSGDGSALSGINLSSKSFIANGVGQVSGATYSLVNNTYGEGAALWFGMASGTAVSAGTFQSTGPGLTLGRTGYGIMFGSVTATGTATLNYRYRLNSQDSSKLIGQGVSFNFMTLHNIGSAKNYTIYFNKATVQDDFTSVTAIANSGAISVPNNSNTRVKYESVNVGACGNGLEIIITIDCGAITSKSAFITEVQLELGATATDYVYRTYYEDRLVCAKLLSNTLDVSGLSALGSVTVGSTLQVTGAVSGAGIVAQKHLGNWASASSDHEYTAATDGIVSVYMTAVAGSGSNFASAVGYTGATDSQATCGGNVCGSATGLQILYGGFSYPVISGDKWQVQIISSGGSFGVTVYWIPLVHG